MQVLVDHAGADVGDFGTLGEPVDDERVQILVVSHGDVNEEILGSRDDEDADRLGQLGGMNVSQDVNDTAGFAPEEIITSEPTRSARLKWVIVADEAIPAGLMANAVACIASSTAAAVTGLIGPGGRDASGHRHPGLPWAGCTVLTASAVSIIGPRNRISKLVRNLDLLR